MERADYARNGAAASHSAHLCAAKPGIPSVERYIAEFILPTQLETVLSAAELLKRIFE